MANLMKWKPFDELAGFWPRDLFSRDLFGRDLLGRLRPDGEMALEWSPRCDVTEGDDMIVVHAELPGVEAKDVDVSITGSHLVVRGEKRTEVHKEEKDRTYSERFFGTFERMIRVPEGVDQSKIEAKLKDGVLEVRVPLPAAARPEATKIPVATG